MSPNRLTPQQIADIADLIKIFIPEDQLDEFQDQLETALDATDVFDELDTEDIEESATSISTINVFRDDIAQAGLSQKESLQNASQTDGGYIVVQRVVRK